MCHCSFDFLPPLPKQTTTFSILQQSIGLRFYFHCVFEQVMGITTGVNNTFHASRFSRKLYFIGAELRFVRSAQALPRARPVGGLDTLVGTASNTQQRSARHRRVTASKQPRRKTSNWFPSQFFHSFFFSFFFYFKVRWKCTTVWKQVNGHPEEHIIVKF